MTETDGRLPADLVLEGGGVRGVGLAGAVVGLLGRYRFERVAGTSAGAVLAALVAAGLDAEGVRAAAARLDYSRVPDSWAPVPVLAPAAGLLTRAGLHPGRYLTRWLRDELAALGVRTFGDLRRSDPGDDPSLPPERRYRLVVIAADVTRGRLVRLPWDYAEYGLDPDTQDVAAAVRASASIPLYFAPQTLTDPRTGRRSTLVDGAVLSNFPVEVFDRTDSAPPRWPTFGVGVDDPAGDDEVSLLGSPLVRAVPPLRVLDGVLATAVTGRDRTYLAQPCVQRRTFAVDTAGVGVTDFGISAAERARLVANGERAAAGFLARWDWPAYLRTCRGVTEPAATG